jgi:hypothetical protein
MDGWEEQKKKSFGFGKRLGYMYTEVRLLFWRTEHQIHFILNLKILLKG